jgi:hypothetical protein
MEASGINFLSTFVPAEQESSAGGALKAQGSDWLAYISSVSRGSSCLPPTHPFHTRCMFALMRPGETEEYVLDRKNRRVRLLGTHAVLDFCGSF